LLALKDDIPDAIASDADRAASASMNEPVEGDNREA
jgi:hypothetical protein